MTHDDGGTMDVRLKGITDLLDSNALAARAGFENSEKRLQEVELQLQTLLNELQTNRAEMAEMKNIYHRAISTVRGTGATVQ